VTKHISNLVGAAILVALTIAVGYVHGRLTNRWGLRPDVQNAGKRLRQTPLDIGDWRAPGDTELDPQVQQILQTSGSLNRVYENKRTGDRVSIAVLLGPAGPIAVHTPEVCYSSQNFQVQDDRKSLTLASVEEHKDELWELGLQAKDVSASNLRVLYGWTNNRFWNASENPRFLYGGSPFLYKLQLAGPPSLEGQKRDICKEFLGEFLPVLRKYMIEVQP
jgi:Protein of unknown function (DUF3485)